MLVGYLGWLCWTYRQTGLMNTISEQNSFFCRGLTALSVLSRNLLGFSSAIAGSPGTLGHDAGLCRARGSERTMVVFPHLAPLPCMGSSGGGCSSLHLHPPSTPHNSMTRQGISLKTYCPRSRLGDTECFLHSHPAFSPSSPREDTQLRCLIFLGWLTASLHELSHL